MGVINPSPALEWDSPNVSPPNGVNMQQEGQAPTVSSMGTVLVDKRVTVQSSREAGVSLSVRQKVYGQQAVRLP